MDIHWLLLGGGPFYGWWGVVVDIFCLVVGSGGCILTGGGCSRVGGGGYILAGGVWW